MNRERTLPGRQTQLELSEIKARIRWSSSFQNRKFICPLMKGKKMESSCWMTFSPMPFDSYKVLRSWKWKSGLIWKNYSVCNHSLSSWMERHRAEGMEGTHVEREHTRHAFLKHPPLQEGPTATTQKITYPGCHLSSGQHQSLPSSPITQISSKVKTK